MTNTTYELKTYQRVVLLLSRGHPPQRPTIFERLWRLLTSSDTSLTDGILPGKMYLRIFKDIEMSDVDMLVPGSRVQLSTFDFFLIWIPLMLGIGFAIWKAVNGTLNFNTFIHALSSILLVGLPLIYAARAYLQFRNKRKHHQASLVKTLCLQTIANNSGSSLERGNSIFERLGALMALLGEVADQEIMDALLAYAFSWKGKCSPTPLPVFQLAKEVEDFLNPLIRSYGIDASILFNVKDACDKLMEMGLLRRHNEIGSDRWVQAVDIRTAIDTLSFINIS